MASHHVVAAVNGFDVIYVNDNGSGMTVAEHIPNRYIAERIARWKDVQLATAALDRAIERLDAAD